MKQLEKWIIDTFFMDKGTKGQWMVPEITWSEEGLNPWSGGHCKYYPFKCEIVIRPKYINDIGIQEHEITHARQYGRLFWLHNWLRVFPKYTLWVELEAFRAQVKQYNYTSGHGYRWIIKALTDPKRYNLKMTYKEAKVYADYMFKDIIEANKKK